MRRAAARVAAISDRPCMALPGCGRAMPIPQFESGTGNLPPGIHEATWSEIERRYGTTRHRRLLLRGLRAGLDSLQRAGCRRAYINGSFVTKESKPRDFDALWEREGVRDAVLDPVILDSTPPREAQKRRYRGEFLPIDSRRGVLGTVLLEFFQKDREGRRKGIVALDLRGWR
jgi:hypothetical protein